MTRGTAPDPGKGFPGGYAYTFPVPLHPAPFFKKGDKKLFSLAPIQRNMDEMPINIGIGKLLSKNPEPFMIRKVPGFIIASIPIADVSRLLPT